MSGFDKETEDVEFFGYTAWMNSANSLCAAAQQALSVHGNKKKTLTWDSRVC